MIFCSRGNSTSITPLKHPCPCLQDRYILPDGVIRCRQKISRVVNRSSHGSSKVVTRCHQSRRGHILVVTSVVTCHEH
jgi:hypothetical protein